VNITATPDGGYNFVNWTGDVGTIDNVNAASTTITMSANYSITANFEAAPAENAPFIGNLTFPGTQSGRVTNATVYDNSSKAWQFSRNATTNNSGYFTVDNVTPGTWDVLSDNCSDLTEMNLSRTFTAGNTTYVDFGASREGDCSDDDYIDALDGSLLNAGWKKMPGQSGYSACKDFNRDNYLDALDRSIMNGNWKKTGDLQGYLSG